MLLLWLHYHNSKDFTEIY